MRLLRGILAVFFALALSGCGQGARHDAATAGSPASSPTTSVANAATTDLDQGPRAGESPADEKLAEEGEQLFKDKGCSACHTFGRKLTGPDLAGVTGRRTARWIESQILHPEVMVKQDPIAKQLFAQFMLQMPNQGLTEVQARAIIEYFKYHDHESAQVDD